MADPSSPPPAIRSLSHPSDTDRINGTHRETDLPRLWSVSALARHLNLSRPTIYKRMADGTFEVMIVGAAKRITERSVRNHLLVLRRGQR